MKQIWLIIALAIVSFRAQAANEPVLLAMGAQAGIQDVAGQRIFAFEPYVEAGPADGIQVRLGAALGVLGESSLVQLETLVLFNLRLGARVYVGGGVGVAWRSEAATPTQMRIPLLVLVGLKTQPMGPWTFSVEGMMLISAGFQERLSFRFSAGALLSL